jgi:hypothetical protein
VVRAVITIEKLKNGLKYGEQKGFCLFKETKNEIDMFHIQPEYKKLRSIAEFPSALQLSCGTTVNFSDSMEVFKLNIGLLKRLV